MDRALEKLRRALVRKGVSSTSAALAFGLSSQAMAAVPAGLAVSVTTTALASVAVAGVSGATLAMSFMGITKLQMVLAGALAVGGAAGWWVQSNAALRVEPAQLQASTASLESLLEENRRLKSEAAEVHAWRRDEVELARLADGAALLKQQLDTMTRTRVRSQALAAVTLDGKPVLKMSEVDQPPTMRIRGTPPVYPQELRSAGVGGEAVVRFVVDASGQVRDVEVAQATHEAFGKAALATVRSWAFEAGKKGNLPVNVQVSVPVVFTLNDDDGRDRHWF